MRAALPGARIRGTGFRGVFTVEGAGEALDLAELVCSGCSERIGHVTAVLALVESRLEPIKEAATAAAAAYVRAGESFCFRLHKRGAHGLEQDTAKIEEEIGGAIWTVLHARHNEKPKVSLKKPDVTVTAEILGPVAAVGVSRRVWFHDQRRVS